VSTISTGNGLWHSAGQQGEDQQTGQVGFHTQTPQK
jgi:hypothetical protein